MIKRSYTSALICFFVMLLSCKEQRSIQNGNIAQSSNANYVLEISVYEDGENFNNVMGKIWESFPPSELQVTTELGEFGFFNVIKLKCGLIGDREVKMVVKKIQTCQGVFNIKTTKF